MPPLSAGVIDIARELSDAVPGLEVTDGIILAHAMADPYSVLLATSDRVQVNNAAIILYEKTARVEGRRNTLLRLLDPNEAAPAV